MYNVPSSVFLKNRLILKFLFCSNWKTQITNNGAPIRDETIDDVSPSSQSDDESEENQDSMNTTEEESANGEQNEAEDVDMDEKNDVNASKKRKM